MILWNEELFSPDEEKKSSSPADNAPSVYSVDLGTAEQRFASAEPKRNKRYDDDDFWDLGETRRKVYQKPSFSGKPIENTMISKSTEAAGGITREPIPKTEDARESFSSKLYKRAADNTAIPTAEHNSRKQIPTSRYHASRPESARDVQNRQNEALRNAKTERSYDCDGMLIRHVEIKPWAANVRFYERFAAEAELFHEKTGSPCPAVSFFAYVPQYSKMNDKQQNFYLYVRDSIRNGDFMDAEISYLLLYVFEIINLPHRIPPETGVRLLSDIWLNYRDRHPRLDIFLCEWLADYCLIHAIPLPRRLAPILPQIVQKAQFKELYLDLLPDSNMESLSKALMEFSSDYDYRRSRYYKDHKDTYEEKIPAAVAAALIEAQRNKRGIFAFEKKYRVTRDAYCGAVTPAEIKRRIDVEFNSFTRPLEARDMITNLVKYAENQLRLTLKIKAKLGVGELDAADRESIDRFFAPMMPQKRRKSVGGEEEYLKFYEAENAGFDFRAAEEIEQMSWNNTNKLTQETEEEPSVFPEEPSVSPLAETEDLPTPSTTADVELAPTANELSMEKACLRAAMEGNFRSFCKENGLFADNTAAKINEIFLDIIGDIVLEGEDGDYRLIEDYREDVLEWLN